MDKAGKNQSFGELTLDQLREKYSGTIGIKRRAALLASINAYLAGY